MGRQELSLRPYAADALGVFAQQIRLERTLKRLTQKQLANWAGVSVGTIAQIERADPNVSIGRVFNVATALGMRLFGADPAEMARRHVDARRVESLIPKRVIPIEIDDDF